MKKFFLLFGLSFFIITPITLVISCTDEEYDKNIDYNEEEVQLLDDFKFKLTYYIKEFYSSKKNAINISYEDSVNSDNLFINPKNLSELEINSDGKANVSNEQFYRLQKDFDKIINFEALKKYVTESFEKDHNYSRIKKFIPKQLLNSIEIDQGNIGVEFLTDDKKNFQLKISSMVHYQYYDLAKNLQTKFTSPINVTISILNDKHFIEIINDFINGFSVNFYKELLQNGNNYENIFFDLNVFRDDKEKYKIANYQDYILEFANNNIINNKLDDKIIDITEKYFNDFIRNTSEKSKPTISTDNFQISSLNWLTLIGSLLKFTNNELGISKKDNSPFLDKIFFRNDLVNNTIDVAEISKWLAEQLYSKKSIENHTNNAINYISNRLPEFYHPKISEFFENPIGYTYFSFEGIFIENEGVKFNLEPIEVPILFYLGQKEDSTEKNDIFNNNLSTDGIVETFDYFFKDVLGFTRNPKKDKYFLNINNTKLKNELEQNHKHNNPLFTTGSFFGVNTKKITDGMYSGFKDMKNNIRYQTNKDFVASSSWTNLKYWESSDSSPPDSDFGQTIIKGFIDEGVPLPSFIKLFSDYVFEIQYLIKITFQIEHEELIPSTSTSNPLILVSETGYTK